MRRRGKLLKIFKAFINYFGVLRFHTTFRLHNKASKYSWYRDWHDLKFSRHFHFAILAIYIIGLITSAFAPSPQAYAAANTWSQTTFNGTSDGTYTTTQAANTNADVSLAGSGMNSYSYKKKITFNTSVTGANVATNQTNFPVTVSINASSWTDATERNNFFGAYNVSGKRIRFYDADGTTNLPYEVDYYNSGTPEATYWVKVPQVDGNSTTDSINVYYGNDPYGTNQDAPSVGTSVWDTSTVGNWLFNERTGTNIANHTTTANLGATTTGTPTWEFDGPMGRSLHYNNNYSTVAANAALSSSYVTAQVLVNYAGWNGYQNWVLSHEWTSWSSPNYQYTVGTDSNYPASYFNTNSTLRTISMTPTIGLNEWHLITFTYDGSNAYMYTDGVQSPPIALSGTITQATTPLNIARRALGGTIYSNVRVSYASLSNIGRSADWVKLSYNTMKKTAWLGDSWMSWSPQQLGYASSGTYVSALIAPAGLYGNWGNLSFTHCDAAHTSGCTGTYTGTTATFQVLKSDGALVPDSDLSSNSTGFSASPVSLATLSTANYPGLKIRVNLSTSDANYTPLLNDWSLGYSNDTVQAPVSVTATPVNSTDVSLSWSVTSQATMGYLVERAPDSSGNPGTWATAAGTCSHAADTYAASIKTTSCSDSGLTANTKYYWRVRSVDLNNNFSSFSGDLRATGGTITYTDASGLNPRFDTSYVGGYVVHTFTAGGTFSVANPNSATADLLVVAGGGGGGGYNAGNGGGGGGGGVITDNGHIITNQSYTITVGNGGSRGGSNVYGSNGNNSVFDNLTAIGGGGGGAYNVTYSGHGGGGGANGGSGGGIAQNTDQSATGGNGTAGQGNNGGGHGSYSYPYPYGGSGGGGAGAVGGTPSGTNGTQAGSGGIGVASSISGTSTYYGGGGGGSSHGSVTYIAPGGNGGGGAGQNKGTAGVDGTANRGGGGGAGGENVVGGNGGSGVVIIRYPYIPLATATTLAVTPTLNSITSPTNNTKPVISGSTSPNVNVKLFDNVAEVASKTADGSGNFTFTAGDYLQALSEGNHTALRAKAQSLGGDWTDYSAPVTVFIDLQAPNTGYSTAPTPADGNNGWFMSNPLITLSPSDPAPSGGGVTTSYKWGDPSLTGATTYSVPINMGTTIGQGTHTLYWRSSDGVGNQESIKSQEFKLDSVAPVTNAQASLVVGDDSGYLNSASSGLVDLHLSATDATSGMNKVIISMDGVLYNSGSTDCTKDYSALIAGFNLDIQTCGVNITGDGSKTLYVKFTDIAGNVTSPVSKTVVYDATNPNNTDSVAGYSLPSAETPDITSSTWAKYSNPTFKWSGATDGTAGLKDYWVYFGTDQNAEPKDATNSGNLFYADNGNNNRTTATSYIVTSSLTSGQTYYLKVRARDNALNNAEAVYNENANLFVYKFDATPPATISYIRTTPAGFSSDDSFSFEWDQVTDSDSGTNKYQYKKADGVDSWHDIANVPDPVSGKISISGITHYREDQNKILVKSIDNAGNESAEATGYYYYAGDIPAPGNLSVHADRSQNNSVNSYSFSWDKPNYSGVEGYYYSVNAQPNAQNSTYIPSTANAVQTPYAAFATQKGPNTFYVVTKANGSVGWSNFAQTTFTCETTAPGIPRNVMITDSSNRDSQRWQLTVNWDQPENISSDFNGYIVERSTDGENFSQIASTSEATTGYLDTNLLNIATYYYRIYAKDNTGNKSAASSVVSKQPTGKYTSPPDIIGEPKISVQATKAVVTWTTSRDADSFVQIGATTDYGMTQGQLDSTSTHTVNLLGLAPGTTYHYRSMWRDIDGNIGYSKDLTFRTQDAPGISEVAVSDIRLDSAIISWKSTTISTSKVLYGKTNTYGMTAEDRSSSGVTVHVIKLDNLNHSSTYHFKITSVDVDGNVISSDDYAFDTLTFPRISNIKLEQMKSMATSTIQATWESNVPVSSIVTFYEGSSNTGHEVSKSILTLKHTLLVTNLKDNTPYRIVVSGRDGYGNEASSETFNFKTDFDTRPPEISEITTETSIIGYGVEAKSQVIVSWFTDEAATSQVEYNEGVSGETFSMKTQEDSNLTTSHVIVISDLKPSSSYYFRVKSKDNSDNGSVSAVNSVLTDQAQSSIFDVILKTFENTLGWLFRR